MKNNKTQLALLVAAALVGFARAQAETITLSSQFTPLENLSAQERMSLQQKIESLNPLQLFDWDQVVVGKNENGKIEIRDKTSLSLQAVVEPSCVSK